MRNFNDNRKSGGGNRGGGGGRGGFGGGRGQGRSEMHQATCSDCGNRCEVPFRPTGNKPVFCNNCFKKEDSGRSNDRRGGGRDSGRPGMHKATCSDCGNRCEVPFRPTGDKPVYCDDCFGGSKGKDFGQKKPDQSNEQFEQLNKKLDKILKILEVIHPKKTHVIEKPAEGSEQAEAEAEKESSEEIEEVKPAKKVAKKKVSAKKATKKTATKKVAKKVATKKKPAKKKK